MECQLVMVIVFELEDSFTKTSFTWTERREYLFENKLVAQSKFREINNSFRQNNPSTYKTAFAIYEPIKD